MAKPLEYQVITASTEDELTNKVNGVLNDGWELCGGLACTSNGNNIMFAQSVMRPKKQEPHVYAV